MNNCKNYYKIGDYCYINKDLIYKEVNLIGAKFKFIKNTNMLNLKSFATEIIIENDFIELCVGINDVIWENEENFYEKFSELNERIKIAKKNNLILLNSKIDNFHKESISLMHEIFETPPLYLHNSNLKNALKLNKLTEVQINLKNFVLKNQNCNELK